MNLSLLKTFVTVVEAGNFSRAASRLHLSQPAVSMQMQSLAQDLGLELFHRSGHRLETTEAGAILYQKAKDLLRYWQATVYQLDSLSQRLRGRLELGASTTPADYLLPPILCGFYRLHPELEVQMMVASSAKVQKALEEGRLDLAVVGYRPRTPTLEGSVIFRDELAVVFAPEHNLAGAKTLRLETLMEQPLLQRTDGSASRQVLEQTLRESDYDPGKLKIVMELGSTRAVLEAAACNLGVAVVSKLAAADYIERGRLLWLPVSGLTLQREFWLVQSHRPHSSIHKAFVQYLLRGANNG